MQIHHYSHQPSFYELTDMFTGHKKRTKKKPTDIRYIIFHAIHIPPANRDRRIPCNRCVNHFWLAWCPIHILSVRLRRYGCWVTGRIFLPVVIVFFLGEPY